mgnify:CR=1 FL=1
MLYNLRSGSPAHIDFVPYQSVEESIIFEHYDLIFLIDLLIYCLIHGLIQRLKKTDLQFLLAPCSYHTDPPIFTLESHQFSQQSFQNDSAYQNKDHLNTISVQIPLPSSFRLTYFHKACIFQALILRQHIRTSSIFPVLVVEFRP